jgi:NAD-dependent dihydropyrimidine dehydrogenase PreA subunit
MDCPQGELSMALKVEVEGEGCKGCEDCLEVCTAGVFEMKEGKSVPVNVEACLGCGSCVEVCKEKAITVEELKSDLSDVARSLLGDIL